MSLREAGLSFGVCQPRPVQKKRTSKDSDAFQAGLQELEVGLAGDKSKKIVENWYKWNSNLTSAGVGRLAMWSPTWNTNHCSLKGGRKLLCKLSAVVRTHLIVPRIWDSRAPFNNGGLDP